MLNLTNNRRNYYISINADTGAITKHPYYTEKEIAQANAEGYASVADMKAENAYLQSFINAGLGNNPVAPAELARQEAQAKSDAIELEAENNKIENAVEADFIELCKQSQRVAARKLNARDFNRFLAYNYGKGVYQPLECETVETETVEVIETVEAITEAEYEIIDTAEFVKDALNPISDLSEDDYFMLLDFMNNLRGIELSKESFDNIKRKVEDLYLYAKYSGSYDTIKRKMQVISI